MFFVSVRFVSMRYHNRYQAQSNPPERTGRPNSVEMGLSQNHCNNSQIKTQQRLKDKRTQIKAKS
ncbi:MAG TPA: hypothetical protein DCE56_29495 [Cyanobacteria bacterium UBA8553]|nr:hypothetical protein [Cyanobacteria bacterium UBA8553]